MQFDLIKMFHEMDWMARGVTFALLIMGIASLTVAIERVIAYTRSRSQSAEFSAQAAPLVADRNYDKLLQTAEKYTGSHLSRMLAPALKVYLTHEWQAMDKAEAVVELVRRELARRQEEASTNLRKGLSVLASVGSVAPFVGLLGTVVGIIAAFGKISITGSGGLGSVAGGISEALIVTALGLLIAIPAVLIFNSLSGRADKIQQGLVTSAGEFIDHLEFGHQLMDAKDAVAAARTWSGAEQWSVEMDAKPPRSRSSIIPEINVTPLVDVVLVLLIIFMVIAPQLEAGERVELPGIKNVDEKAKLDAFTLTVTVSGRYLLEKDLVEEAALLKTLTAAHEKEPEKRMVLKADRGVKYETMRKLFAQAQEIGFKGVALMVDEKKVAKR